MSLAMHEEVIRESTARANAEHENTQSLRLALADTTAKHAAEIAHQSERYDALLEKYHALRERGFAPMIDAASIPMSPAPLSLLGELTKAALLEMSTGLPAANRRAMEARALVCHANKMPDAELAALVRRGETIRPMPD